mgnify:CR=1 FL=1
MRIDKLQVHNFRGFSDTEIVLNGKDAIFYGVNGMGKSSILDVCNLLFSRIMQEAAQDEQQKEKKARFFHIVADYFIK